MPFAHPVRVFATAALLTLAACSGHTPPSDRATSSNRLTADEIAAAPVNNAYDALERLRPNFLRPRVTASRTSAYATVFIDGVRRGPLEVLRSVAATTVVEMRLINAADATTRYGLDIPGGVIEVQTIRR
jgi:hypothetical protein